MRLNRPLAALAVLTLAALPARAQPPAHTPNIQDLPGMGRPIDTAATAAWRGRLMQEGRLARAAARRGPGE